MYCTKCNLEISDEKAFCPYCGSRQEKSLNSLSSERADTSIPLKNDFSEPKQTDKGFFSKKFYILTAILIILTAAILGLIIHGNNRSIVKQFMQDSRAFDDSILICQNKCNKIYIMFDEQGAINPASNNFKVNAYEVKQRSDELFNFIQDLMIEIITEAEGNSSGAVTSREIDLTRVRHLNNESIPYEILIGPNENGKANDLKALLASYNDDMTLLVGDDMIAGNIIRNSAVKTNDLIVNYRNGEKQIRWENYNFEDKTLWNSLITLKKFQLQARSVELTTINSIHNKMIKVRSN